MALAYMTVAVRSFAKINLGLYIGARRADGFHDLRTVYQTIALHDVIRVSVEKQNRRGSDMEGRETEIVCQCDDPRVPLDSSNTCHRIAGLVMKALGTEGEVTIEIEKRLPVQGGLGAASSNAVATLLAIERALDGGRPSKRSAKSLTAADRLQLAARVGSDLPLFVLGGTVLGTGHGEEVYPLADLPITPMVVVTPDVGVSTPKAFADWDALVESQKNDKHAGRKPARAELTHPAASDRLFEVGCALSAWLRGNSHAGAPAKAGGRAGSLLSDLVRAGIENDFERVVFSQIPELRDIKCAVERAGSEYASLSGSGSTLYGLFRSAVAAERAARFLQKQGLKAVATRTLTRQEYWEKLLVSSC
jgi:4-diphosphocytidyl-2-C-methyl-D-erythritol kinase